MKKLLERILGRRLEPGFVTYAEGILVEDMDEDDKETLEMLYDLWKTANEIL